jgi:hypothetical protein
VGCDADATRTWKEDAMHESLRAIETKLADISHRSDDDEIKQLAGCLWELLRVIEPILEDRDFHRGR